MFWKNWKQSFDTWEDATARLLDSWMQSPTVLSPAGKLMGAAMRLKAANQRAVAAWWSSLGLATRHDQERALHALNQMQSKLFDLEEKLSERDRS